MKVKDLYSKYNLMPQLIEHQLRVGGIVRLISDDRDSVLTALVHDMGNLAKFTSLDEHWSREQVKFWELYGHDAHVATSMILKEAGLDKLHDNLQDEARFYQDILQMDDYSQVSKPAYLTLYGDTRVAYRGVVSMEERIRDLEERYHEKRSEWVWGPKLEEYVQSTTKIDVTKITEEMVEPLFSELLGYNI